MQILPLLEQSSCRLQRLLLHTIKLIQGFLYVSLHTKAPFLQSPVEPRAVWKRVARARRVMLIFIVCGIVLYRSVSCCIELLS